MRITESTNSLKARFAATSLYRFIGEREWLYITVNVGLLLIVFLIVEYISNYALKAPIKAYESKSILISYSQFIQWNLGKVAIALLIAALLIPLWKLKWQELDHGAALKRFVVLLSGLMVWFVVTLDHNHYFNQNYAIDKLAALVFLGLLIWRPVFIFPLLVVTFLLFWQLTLPALNNGSHLAHKVQVLHVLNLFGAWLLLHLFKQKRSSTEFIFLTACLVASAYWAPAIKKLLIGWLYSGEIHTMLLNAHAHGWLSFLDASKIVSYSQSIAIFDWPMRLAVFAFEAGCLFFLWRRWYATTLLASLMLFHIGVFLLFGYLFWTWILLNGALLLLLVTQKHAQVQKLFNKTHLVLGIVLILTSQYWSSPAQLAWIDGRISYTYRYEAVGISETRYQIPFRYFEPYGDVFTMANFSYLVDEHNMLANPYGSTTRKHADALLNAKDIHDVIDLEKSIGWNAYNEERRNNFREFLTRFINNAQEQRAANWQSTLQPPRQFWTQPRGNVYANQEPILKIIVSEVTTLFDGNELKELRDIEIMKIEVEQL